MLVNTDTVNADNGHTTAVKFPKQSKPRAER